MGPKQGRRLLQGRQAVMVGRCMDPHPHLLSGSALAAACAQAALRNMCTSSNEAVVHKAATRKLRT